MSRHSAGRPALRRTARTARRHVLRLVHRLASSFGSRHPGVDLPAARCTYFAVLGGAALNLYAELPPGSLSGTAEVFFLRGERELRAPGRAASGSGGRGVEATVPLGDGPGEVPLANGTWLVGVAVGGQRLVLRMSAASEGSGSTESSPVHPRSGRHYRSARGPHGHCRLIVSGPKPRAEVTRIVLGPTAAEIHGRLVGREASAGGAAVFVPRTDRDPVQAPVEFDGEGFRVRTPLDDLASGPDGVEVIWDVWLRLTDDRRLRVGRFLHDVGDPRGVFRISRVTIPLGIDRFAGIRPYYTPAGNLAVALLAFTRYVGDRG